MVTIRRVAFFGTPAFAVPTLAKLVEARLTIVAVVTQPDRPSGRGQKVQPSAVAEFATEHGLLLLQPHTLRDPAWLPVWQDLAPDLAVVAAYGHILPTPVLDVPALGFLNVHASLLPRWRGAAPIHRAILAGDASTGVTIMRVVPALDAGPMLARWETPIGPDETSVDLETRLAHAGAELLIDTIARLASGTVHAQTQDDAQATYAKKLLRADGAIRWDQPAARVHDQIRGLHPWPLAAGILNGRRLLLHESERQPGRGRVGPQSSPGTVLQADRDGLVIAAIDEPLRIVRLQPEGRPVMSAAAYLNGTRVRVGDRFEPA